MKRRCVRIILIALSSVAPCHAADYVWTGAGKDGFWNTPANWKPDTGFPRSGDHVMFPKAAASTTINLNGNQAVRSITFDPVVSFSYTLAGNTLTLDDGGSLRGLKYAAGSAAVMIVTSDLHLAGKATFANGNIWFLGEERLSIRGRLTGTGTLTIGELDGCVELAGDNSGFTGSVVIDKGMLLSNHLAALGGGTSDVVMNGGALWFGGGPGTLTRNSRIAGPATWSCVTVNGPHEGTVTVNPGTTWTLDDGGSGMPLRGVITGEGNWHIIGGGSVLTGARPNTLSGTVTIRGATTLAKSDGVNALASAIVLEPNGKIHWSADEQIADQAPLKFAGDLTVLDLKGHRETLGTVDLQGHATIECGEGANVLRAADSHSIAWDVTKELIVNRWKGKPSGAGQDQIVFGKGPDALTTQQLACIGFRNPAGLPAGLYTCAILKTGELVPGHPVQPVNPPYDVTASAKAGREKLYQVPGLANLSGKNTPLKKDMKIAFFGDSLTWQNGYIGAMDAAFKAGEGTKNLGVKFINHGVNGGGVLTLRDGDDTPAAKTSHAGGTKPRPFVEYLAEDKPEVAVIFIGINDIWWRKTGAADFEKALGDMVVSAKANKTVPVLATLAVLGDDPSVANVNNAKCDEYAEITRKVAAAKGATLVDLRKACFAYLQNYNCELRLNGSIRFAPAGILTGDGVHANGIGCALIAEKISQGIIEALKK